MDQATAKGVVDTVSMLVMMGVIGSFIVVVLVIIKLFGISKSIDKLQETVNALKK